MEKKFLMMAAIAGMLAACSNDADPVQEAAEVAKQNTQVAQQVPVEFGAYVNRATTRAGYEGALTTTQEGDNNDLQEVGFGVIAFYTDDDLYSPIYQPNFMYNTKVTKGTAEGAGWEYTPVRYWPNETGAGATSDGVDRLSFFAYAPYVPVIPETGLINTGTDGLNLSDASEIDKAENYGIVGLTRNAAVGDPFVKYNVNLDPAHQVDFCWGVTPSSSYTLSSVETGTSNTLTEGAPLLNLLKPGVTTNNQVKFDFKHALAALNVQVDAIVNEVNSGSNELNEYTKIYVRKVTFEGFVTQGSFNLNTKYSGSSSPAWFDFAGSNYINGGQVTVYDGRTDGREALSAADSEQPKGLNAKIIQSAKYTETVTDGVKKTAVNLFNSETSGAALYVIPSGQPLKVTIEYDVETRTDELPTYLADGVAHGTSVKNTITKSIVNGSSEPIKLEAGKKYTINLHLGMNEVKFNASVSEWPESTETGSAGLPSNVTGS